MCEQAELCGLALQVAIERAPGSTGWQTVQDICATELKRFGYQVERQPFDGGTNVIGRRAGKGDADAQVVVSTHYDHIKGCTGAVCMRKTDSEGKPPEKATATI